MKDEAKKQLGERIKKKRNEAGLSQLELAEKMHKSSAAYIAYIEGGDRNISSIDLMRLAQVLGTTVSELLGEQREEVSFLGALRSLNVLSNEDKEKIENYYVEARGDSMKDFGGFDDSDLEPRYNLAKSESIRVWKDLCGEKIPVVLNDIVTQLGIKVKAMELNSASGYSQIDSEGFSMIIYNSKEPRLRQRFSVAHELAHIILEHITIDGDTKQHSHNSQEKEANLFAGELLVPSFDLRKFMKDSDKNVDDIRDRYQVSKEVATAAILRNRLLNKVKV